MTNNLSKTLRGIATAFTITVAGVGINDNAYAQSSAGADASANPTSTSNSGSTSGAEANANPTSSSTSGSTSGADSSSVLNSDPTSTSTSGSSSQATGGNGYGGAGGDGGNASAGADATGIGHGGAGGEGGSASAGADASSDIKTDLTSTQNGGDHQTDVKTGDTSTSGGNINLDQGGNRIFSSVVTYPSNQAVLKCDISNHTITLNTVFGGISWGESSVASMGDLERCNLSRVVQNLLIPEAQSGDPTAKAKARRHLDALIPDLGLGQNSNAYLERFAEVLGAGVNFDKASHPSRREILVTVLESDFPLEVSPFVEFLNNPPGGREQEILVEVYVDGEDTPAASGKTTEQELSQKGAGSICKPHGDVCGQDVRGAVERAADAARKAPQLSN